jgi:hypothetical protein
MAEIMKEKTYGDEGAMASSATWTEKPKHQNLLQGHWRPKVENYKKEIKGTVSRDGFGWFLKTCMVSSRPIKGAWLVIKFFRCSYDFVTQKVLIRVCVG